MDIKNKEIRLELIARYLNAEISPAEEKMLMEYYGSNNHVDDDEQAFAQMIRIEKMNVSLLSDEGVEEFDRIIGEAKQETKPEIDFEFDSILEELESEVKKL